MHNYHQYDDDRFKIVRTAIKAAIGAKESLEQTIASEKFNKFSAMQLEGDETDIDKKYNEQRVKVQGWVEKAVQLALNNIRDPEHLVFLVKLLKKKKDVRVSIISPSYIHSSPM